MSTTPNADSVLLFAYDGYYPSGGAFDYVGKAPLDQAVSILDPIKAEFAHAFDPIEGVIVRKWRRTTAPGRHYATGSWEQQPDDGEAAPQDQAATAASNVAPVMRSQARCALAAALTTQRGSAASTLRQLAM
jgi:hypothetical protein